jgi:formylglycine-generating enzyme required for sulfatase activity/serine/threonine protein kinase
MPPAVPEFHREYLVRLPLPLAQLYSRAFNAKEARARHDNAFYLFESIIKLAAAPAIAAYLTEVQRGASRAAALDRLLAQLALPSLGQWVAMLRELARHFGQRPDAAAHPLGHLWGQLNPSRRDLPATLALYRRIKNGPDGEPAGDQSCSLLELLDGLVQYRNGVFGHGASRFDAFYEQEMGPLLLPAASELLAEGVWDLLGPRGSRLVYLTELRTVDEGQVQISLMELVGRESERMAPQELSSDEAAGLTPNCVAVLWPGRKVPLRLDPLLVFRGTELAEEVLFLNRDRNGRQAEYLSYTTGRTERDRSMAPALAKLLSQVAGREVSESELQKISEQSLAETPSVAALFGPGPPTVNQVGDYEILAEIGRGGMGVVYLARQLSLGRSVALKMLPADLAADEVALARFRREMRVLGRCEHPHIVKVLANGTFPDGRLYYTMEYVPGADLEMTWRELAGPYRQGAASTLGGATWSRAVLTASRKQREAVARHAAESSVATGGDRSTKTPGVATPVVAPSTDDVAGATPILPVTVPQLPRPPRPQLPSAEDDPGGYVRRVVALIRDAALALQAVHEQGIVHRDVKPANLMLTPGGQRVVLMDFGLAKGQSVSLSASSAGGLLGTLRYAAPEQLAAATLQVGPTADVRGLGVTLWELLTRDRLFGDAEDERQLAAMVHDQDVPRLRSVDFTLDADLEAIVARATERRASDRIQSAAKLAEYLQMYLDGVPLPIRPPGLIELVRRRIRKHSSLVATMGVALLLIAALTAGLVAKHKRELRYNHAMALVETIRDAELPQAINLIGQLTPERELVDPRLRELDADPSLKPQQRLRIQLALLPIDNRKAADVRQALLEAAPQDALLLRNQLAPQTADVVDSFWTVLQARSDERSPAVLRAACALAVLDPGSQRWAKVASRVVNEMVRDNPIFLRSWVDGLRPVKQALIVPLADVCRDARTGAAERSLATNVIADYAADAGHLDLLTDLMLSGTDDQFGSLFPKIEAQSQTAVKLLAAELDQRQDVEVARVDKERLAKRQAKAAAALVLLDRGELAWPLLSYQPVDSDPESCDPRRRSYLIEQFRSYGTRPDALAARWFVEHDVSIRQALLLALGNYAPQRLSPDIHGRLIGELTRAVQTEPNAGLHSAAEWLLRHWELPTAGAAAGADPKTDDANAGNRGWYVNHEGFTMTVLHGPIEFTMGSPANEDQRIAEIENQHRVRIPRTFSIATKTVTQEQFRRFRADYPDDKLKVYAPHPDCPAISVSWYLAAAYCNWLSEQEGVRPEQWCYPPNQSFADGMRLYDNYLGRTGYRLPTEAEWEYACRAHATTSRFCGDSEELLQHYCWYADNSRDSYTLPVGSMKPNYFGLFDIHGNADEWCQERRRLYPLVSPSQAVDDIEDTAMVRDSEERVLRGGSYGARPAFVRSANRFQARPDTVRRYYSFRIARTMPE